RGKRLDERLLGNYSRCMMVRTASGTIRCRNRGAMLTTIQCATMRVGTASRAQVRSDRDVRKDFMGSPLATRYVRGCEKVSRGSSTPEHPANTRDTTA